MVVRGLRVGFGKIADLVVEVWPRGWSREGFEGCRIQCQAADNVLSYFGRGNRSKSNDRDCWQDERLFEPTQCCVRNPEVMAPFADTVCFVDGDAEKFSLLVYLDHVSAKGLGLAELGRDVEQSSFRMAAEKVEVDTFAFR